MDPRLKFVLSSTIPVVISTGVAATIFRVPFGRALGKTLVLVSGSTLASRIITALITPDVDGWKEAEARYSTQVSLSTGVGIASSLISSTYDSANLATTGINLAVAAIGGWSVGNLIWLGDALVLGESLRPDSFLPDLYLGVRKDM